MKRKAFFPLATVLLIVGLTGCGVNDGANGENYSTNPLPIGYSSNENHENNEGGNARWIDEDNDGPLTEWLDHTLGNEGKNNGTNENNLPNNGTDDTIFNRTDLNYHGHLNENRGGARSSYFTAYEGELAMKISDAASSVVNVADARTVIHKDVVVVGVVLEDHNRAEETRNAIRDAISDYTKGKEVRIVTNDGFYSRIRTIDNTIREGGPRNQIDKDIKNLIRNTRS